MTKNEQVDPPRTLKQSMGEAKPHCSGHMVALVLLFFLGGGAKNVFLLTYQERKGAVAIFNQELVGHAGGYRPGVGAGRAGQHLVHRLCKAGQAELVRRWCRLTRNPKLGNVIW